MEGVKLIWRGGEHTFALPLGELRKLQETCDAGPEEILNKLRLGKWHVDDIIEPLRLGLIGSGDVPREKAGMLVTKLVDQHGLLEFKMTAMAVMAYSLFGPEDDQPKKQPGETSAPEENGDLATSTETEA